MAKSQLVLCKFIQLSSKSDQIVKLNLNSYIVVWNVLFTVSE